MSPCKLVFIVQLKFPLCKGKDGRYVAAMVHGNKESFQEKIIKTLALAMREVV